MAPLSMERVTSITEKYLHFLTMVPSLPPHIGFQNDGAPPCFRDKVPHILNDKLSDLWIGRGGLTTWPACFQNWLLWLFLRGHVRHDVYQTPSSNLRRLKKRTTFAVQGVDSETLKTYGLTQTSSSPLLSNRMVVILNICNTWYGWYGLWEICSSMKSLVTKIVPCLSFWFSKFFWSFGTPCRVGHEME